MFSTPHTVLVPFVLLALAGCDLGPSNIESAPKSQILHLGNGTEPQDLDPHVVTGVTENNIITALLEGLVSENPITLAPEPGIAQSWSVDDSGIRYSFKLRDSARWSNGDPVTAHDFVWSWQRMLSPGLAGEYAYQLFTVKNAEAFNRGDIDNFDEVGVKALDTQTLEVVLENPTPYFLSLLAHYSTFAVHPDTIMAFGKMDQRGSLWTRAGNFVGNGPFVLKAWRLNYVVEVERNPYYWDADRVRLNGIRFYPIDNANTEERMFRTDVLHATSTTPSDKIEVYQDQQPDRIFISPYLGTYFYRFNVTRPPLDDYRVRRALSMTVDREAIVNSVTKGGQLPAFSFTPPNTQGYFPPDPLIQFDPVGARSLLAEAGFPEGQGFPKLTLLYNTSDGHRRIAVAIQQMWKEHLNIEIELENQDWKVYLSRTRDLDYDISRAGWIGDYPDPNTFLDMMLGGGGNNRTGWENPDYDALIRQAATTTDNATRFELFETAESILDAESPLLPIYTYTRVALKHPSLRGWYPNVLDRHPYKYVYIAESDEVQQ
ncbi:MAG: peptide ABC transporter substrate-binding protein [Pseudomonadota bacterium]